MKSTALCVALFFVLTTVWKCAGIISLQCVCMYVYMCVSVCMDILFCSRVVLYVMYFKMNMLIYIRKSFFFKSVSYHPSVLLIKYYLQIVIYHFVFNFIKYV